MGPKFDLSLENISVAVWIVMSAVFILWLISLIDILRNDFKRDVDKLLWFITITLPVLGPILYFFIGFDQKIEKDEDDDSPRRRR